jgi:RNA methyltransferase, TrmH family
VRAITSRHHRIVADYRAAARGESPDVLLLDGPHLVAEAVRAGITIRHAAVRTDAATDGEVAALLDRLARERVDVAPVSSSVMAALSPVKSSSTIVALATRPSGSADRMYGGTDPLVAIAVDVQDPGNVGAIIRVAEASGATGVVAAGACANPFGWKGLRGSMGSALRLPIASTLDAAAALDDARAHGCRIVASVPRGGKSVFDGDYGGATAVLIGGEGSGLPAPIVDAADERVTIPMQAPVESLNTAVAAALVLYEACRQRHATHSRHETHENTKNTKDTKHE